jgi:hypothetical protein
MSFFAPCSKQIGDVMIVIACLMGIANRKDEFHEKSESRIVTASA